MTFDTAEQAGQSHLVSGVYRENDADNRAVKERRELAAAARTRGGAHHYYLCRPAGYSAGSCGQGGDQQPAYARVCDIQACWREGMLFVVLPSIGPC